MMRKCGQILLVAVQPIVFLGKALHVTVQLGFVWTSFATSTPFFANINKCIFTQGPYLTVVPLVLQR